MRRSITISLLAILLFSVSAFGQKTEPTPPVRTVTIPISIFSKKELKENQQQEFLQIDRLIVKEDKDEQQILSIRSVSDSPLSIAVIIQDDLSSNFNLQIADIKDFIRGLPKGTRVMVAYSRAGTTQIRQRFTDDLEKAANSLRIVVSNPSMGPRSPFDGVNEIISRFDGVPNGRRAILLFSDGVDLSQGRNLASVSQSVDLDQSILKAQKKSVAVYSFYSPTASPDIRDSIISLAGQGALTKLSDETGGRSFYSGSMAPVSYLPFFKDLVTSLNRQFSLTYLSTHMKKGYYKVVVQSTNPEIKIEHPKGYYFR